MKDYYRLLGIEYTASDDEINFAYKKMMLRYHPDINKGDTGKIFNDILEGYRILTNPDKRFKYNLSLIEHYNREEIGGLKRVIFSLIKKLKLSSKI